MRILHTSDWHLNDKLGRHERQPDLRARMEEIAALLKAEAVDVMLIAGDFFSDRHARLPELRAALRDFQEAFRPFLHAGGTAVAISGNHDSEDLFELLRTTQDLTASVPKGDGAVPPGRLYLVAQPMVLLMAGRDGQKVQVALLPYPTPSVHFKRDEVFHSAEERNQLLRSRAVISLQQQVTKCSSRPLPSVLVAHLHVRNSELSHSLYRLEERDDVVLDSGLISPAFAYTALGHIHRAQEIDRSAYIRYSGSIERMDVAERDDAKGVVVVEIGAQGAGPPRVLPLDATAIFDEEIHGPEDLPRLEETYTAAQRERGYLRYRLRCRAQDEQSLDRAVRRLFPRWYSAAVEIIDGGPIAAARVSSAQMRDIRGTTRAFVEESLRDHPDREAALGRLESLLLVPEVRS